MTVPLTGAAQSLTTVGQVANLQPVANRLARAKEEGSRTQLFTHTLTVGVLTSAAKLAGAGKTIFMARFFGAGDELDAFLIAFLLPSFVADLIGASLTGALVPQLVRAREAEGPTGGRELADSALSSAATIMLIITGALAASSHWLMPFAAGGFPEEKLRLTTVLFLGLLCWLPMSACSAVWRAVLNAHGLFALPAIAPIASPFMCIACLYAFTRRSGVGVLCIGTVAGVALECFALAIAASRLGYPVVPHWRKWRNPAMAGIARQYLPLLASSGLSSACVLIDQSIAGRLGPGQVSAFVYGTRLTTVMLQVIAMPIGVTILPVLSHLASARDWARVRATVLICGAASAAIAFLLAAGCIRGSEALIRVLFERGAFHHDSARLVAHVQRFSLLQLPFALLLAIGARLASAISANALLARIGVLALISGVVLDLVFSRYLGVAGIALATVFVQIVSLVGLTVLLYRREPKLFMEPR
ncbi:MAG: hypothetical protein JO307_24445 [Bryobacterales bacterium]|nr:hypothetical protein [Bryobacterales bacterium]MBV9398239.1 hypothetical protein [Bryobacterales bacterium]